MGAEVLPRDERNVSIRNEVEIALSKAISFLKQRLERDAAMPPTEKTRLSASAIGFSALALSRRLQSTGGSHDELGQDVLRLLAHSLQFDAKDTDVDRSVIDDAALALALAQMELPDKAERLAPILRRLLARRAAEGSAHPGAFVSTSTPGLVGNRKTALMMEQTALASFALRTCSQYLPAGEQWNTPTTRKYILGCRVEDGPAPANLEPSAARKATGFTDTLGGKEATAPATVAAVFTLMLSPEPGSVATVIQPAVAWLGNHTQALLQTPLDYSLLLLTLTLRAWGIPVLSDDKKSDVDLARKLAERLINEQNGDGSFTEAAASDTLFSTSCCVLALSDIYALL